MIALMLAGALLATDPTAPPLSVQDPAPETASQDETAVQLEDVTVTGRTLKQLISRFVAEVAEPNARRGLARWSDRVCVGVANLRGDAAQYLVDRISTVAEDIGLSAGAPGCTPNILVIASDDAGGLAAQLVDERRRAFRMGGSGMDRGGAALRDFVATERPVRWWQMSVPVDSETGTPAVRIPGECRDDCMDPSDYAPVIDVFATSRLKTQIVDDLTRSIVILDVDDVNSVSITQLADYIAMVSLAQIDPEADTSGYASILNVFDDASAAASLTDWDLAYLEGLYSAQRNDLNRRANRSQIAASIQRAHSRMQADQDGMDAAE